MDRVPSSVVRTYPPRGPLQQFRFAEATAFQCFRCGQSKKSKLITIYNGDWSKRLCNGCYGQLLSLHEIKAGTAPDDERADKLALALLSIVGVDAQRQAERLFKVSEARTERLSEESLRFIASAEYVAKHLEANPQLEWSAAVIGLCKAVEIEVVRRILQPLASHLVGTDLSEDRADKDLGRIAAYCADASRKPPELGAFAHFLQTVIHSSHRRATSTLITGFLRLTMNWTGSNWLLDIDGFHAALVALTLNFRNRAAHIDELGQSDYDGCRSLTVGSEGALWRLLLATEDHK